MTATGGGLAEIIVSWGFSAADTATNKYFLNNTGFTDYIVNW